MKNNNDCELKCLPALQPMDNVATVCSSEVYQMTLANKQRNQQALAFGRLSMGTEGCSNSRAPASWYMLLFIYLETRNSERKALTRVMRCSIVAQA